MDETTKTTDTTDTSPVAAETTVATTDATTTVAAPVKRKKTKRSVPHAQVHIYATFNNTIVTFTDQNGGALAASSAGACGFRGSKKGTAYAAQVACEKAGGVAKTAYGVIRVDVSVRGVGLGREAAIRTLSGLSIAVESIRDVTGVPHGGCRPRKAKRN